MQAAALIGHTGFVGGNLAASGRFSHLYNSKNIEEMRGGRFDLVVCAGASAVKWWANQHPAEDWQGVSRLIEVLSTVEAECFVLISTIDVYPTPVAVDESTALAGLPNHAYGTNRYRLEQAIERFPEHHVIRLPGLFGAGLKKNVIFDLLNDNGLEKINPDSIFQYYDLSLLWSDIEKVVANKLELVNFATEPIATRSILDRFFPTKVVGREAASGAAYDMRTLYASRWGRESPYLYDSATILARLGAFLDGARGRI